MDDASIRENILRVATAERAKLAAYWNEDGDNDYWPIGECRSASSQLAEALNTAGFPAKAVMGTYSGCCDAYPDLISEHSIDGLTDDFDHDDWDGSWLHWWVVCDEYIVDITADQFHDIDRETYEVVITSKNDPLYQGERRSIVIDSRKSKGP